MNLALLALVVFALVSRSSSSSGTGYVDGHAFNLQLAEAGDGESLRVDAAAAYSAMKAAAGAVGVSLVLNSGFRTFAQQAALRALYEAGQGALAAEPGHSAHQEGTAADIETDGGRNQAFNWLTFNAVRFGWRRTVASEPWHWEYFA